MSNRVGNGAMPAFNPRQRRPTRLGWLLVVGLACSAPAPPPVPEAGPPLPRATPVDPVAAEVAVTRVKNLLVGLGAEDSEVQAVAADRAALAPLVAVWMQRPEYRRKLLKFFATEFQQNDFGYADLDYQFCAEIPFRRSNDDLVRNMQESFARTVLALIDQGQPLTSAFTTTRFMMTPALMAAYALIDEVRGDNRERKTLPFSITVTAGSAPSIEESLNPQSPQFHTFRGPADAHHEQGSEMRVLADLLFDQGSRRTDPDDCPLTERTVDAYLLDTDFSDWKMVTIRTPGPNSPPTPSYDLPAMRTQTRLTLEVPRVGFFSTPAFAARWPTNKSNQHRVTINQAVIVALGRPIDLTNVTRPRQLVAMDEAHAAAEADCYACHVSLDPMRQFFQQTYTQSFGLQRNLNYTGIGGEFAFHGTTESGGDIASFGRMLGKHPLFAPAWVQKACTWATSAVCDENDPEFKRLVHVFEDSGFQWNALIQALATSPLLTGLDDRTPSVSVARQEHLCATLSARLGVEDACGLEPETPALRLARHAEARPAGWSSLTDVNTLNPFVDCLFTDRLQSELRTARSIATSWPADQYSRGSAARSLVTAPSLLTRGGLESLCTNLADRFVDTEATPLFRSRAPTQSLDNLVARLMGLSKARSSVPRSILQEHFDETRRQGASDAVALKSAFVLACLTPYVAGVGE